MLYIAYFIIVSGQNIKIDFFKKFSCGGWSTAEAVCAQTKGH